MKIIKSGKKHEAFKCKYCGCEFNANLKECVCHNSEYDHSLMKYKFDAQIKCPNCGIYAIKTIYEIGETE